jgi:hypothetical protein
MPTLFYKGVGVGTHHHPTDLRTTGIMPRTAAVLNEVVVQQHVARGTTTSPCVSLTKSYGVAQDYAINSGFAAPTRARPAHVYEVEIPDDAGIPLIDPVDYIASRHANPLVSPSYHHDGDQGFLGIVAYPLRSGGTFGTAPRPPGMGGAGTRPPILSIQLETIVFAIRDAEVLAYGSLPSAWITNRYDVY